MLYYDALCDPLRSVVLFCVVLCVLLLCVALCDQVRVLLCVALCGPFFVCCNISEVHFIWFSVVPATFCFKNVFCSVFVVLT